MANWYWKVVRQFVSERFGISLCRSSCLNWLHRLGFAYKRPKKRLLKANESKREAFVAEYAVLWEEAQRTGARIFFADEAHFRADAELRGKWVLKGKPALVDSSSPRYGEKASYYSAVCLETGEVEWMDMKLQHVISNITGQTGMAIIEAIVSGERDPRQLAKLRDHRIKADEATIARSLQGHWLEEHIFELTQALELYRFYHQKIAECDWEIEAQLERFEDVTDGGSPDGNGRRRSQGNAPRFDIRTHLYRMTGVDLTRIDGVDGFTALKVISEIGTDMTKWPTAKHFASWLGLSPDNRITGGKVKSSKTKPSANRAAAALRMAAHGLHRSDSALGAFLRRKKAHLGAPKAITATAHKLARLIYSMLRYGQDYVDAGAGYYESQYQHRALRAAKRRASQLGYQLVPMSDAQHHDPGVPLNPPAAIA